MATNRVRVGSCEQPSSVLGVAVAAGTHHPYADRATTLSCIKESAGRVPFWPAVRTAIHSCEWTERLEKVGRPYVDSLIHDWIERPWISRPLPAARRPRTMLPTASAVVRATTAPVMVLATTKIVHGRHMLLSIRVGTPVGIRVPVRV